MTTIEKAYKIRNLYNSWQAKWKEEKLLAEQEEKLSKELAKATYSKNGCEHFKVFGAWLNRQEVERNEKLLVLQREKAQNRMKELEEEIEQLLSKED